MKRIALVALIAVGAIAVQADAKSDLQKLYDNLATSVKKKDLKGCLAYLAPDYTDTNETGKKLNRKEFEAMVKQQFAAPITVKTFSIKVTKVTPKGSDLIAENTSKLSLTFANPQTKKNSTMEQTSSSRDTWVKSGGKWLMKSSTTVSTKRFLDGKEIKGQ